MELASQMSDSSPGGSVKDFHSPGGSTDSWSPGTAPRPPEQKQLTIEKASTAHAKEAWQDLKTVCINILFIKHLIGLKPYSLQQKHI